MKPSYEYLRNLLAFLGYSELEESINKSFQQQSALPPHPDAEPKTLTDKLPRIRKSVLGKSNYSPSYGREGKRLKIQGTIARETDLKTFQKVITKWNPKRI